MTDRLIARDQLDPADQAEMLGLLVHHFDGVDAEQFATDLANKNWVVLLNEPTGKLVGFSTIHFFTDRHEGEPISVVFSGDTIVDPSAWHSSALSRLWIASVKELHERFGVGRLFWLLIVSGFRTYRFLPVYWREFYPAYERPTPQNVRALIDRLANARFGDRYLPSQGVVRFEQPQRLRGTLRGIPPQRLTDPHVAFFAASNPGHESGDELVCFTELSDANLTAAGRRMILASTHAGSTP